MQDDRSAIINIVNLYAVAVDARRYDLFAQVFSDDIQCDFGGGAAFTNRDALESAFAAIHAVFDSTQHLTSGHVISLNGDRANCLSYVVGRFRRRLEDGEGFFESAGWYDDFLVRTPVGWRIRERASRMVSTSGDLRVMQVMPGVDTNYELFSLFNEADKGSVRFFSLPPAPGS
ncbi:nuclear transport factor 2 family protein [Aquamicrobium sp.]|uniref:nuclear transport factor 2 family protein n=1 Tax=Aquamicrobium sp. TaxID=1872579 RepID=UPI0025905A12|nr:nuclear transport factor 2 family protein [Aquamicrobium sp.]MCK9553760.1 nuclear transport factor 2 family protein [Aquamicrobium sp.]